MLSDSQHQFILQCITKLFPEYKRQSSEHEFSQKQEYHQTEVRNEHAATLEPAAATPEERHHKHDHSERDEQYVSSDQRVLRQQGRVAGVRDVQPNADAKDAAS